MITELLNKIKGSNYHKDYWLDQYLEKRKWWNIEKKQKPIIEEHEEREFKIEDGLKETGLKDIESLYKDTINERNKIDQEIIDILDMMEENQSVLTKLSNELDKAIINKNQFSTYMKEQEDNISIDKNSNISQEVKNIIIGIRKTEAIKCYQKLNNDIFKIENKLRDLKNEKLTLTTRYNKIKEYLLLYDNTIINQVNDTRNYINILFETNEIEKNYGLRTKKLLEILKL